MKISELYMFVEDTNESKKVDVVDRERIAILGILSEIGSVLAAVKKDILSTSSDKSAAGRYLVSGELKEEIGDAIWYLLMFAQCQDDPRAKNVFSSGLATLHHQLTGFKRDDVRVQSELGGDKLSSFLSAYSAYKALADPTIDDYQHTAFHARRSEDESLRDVCVAVLQQLAAQISRYFLTNMEMELNHQIKPKDPVDAICDSLWHLAALASIYELNFSNIIEHTVKKSQFRNSQNCDGPDHNIGIDGEHFPQKFEVHFLDMGVGKTQMYWVGDGVVKKQLGSPLTDNNHEDDGYRFHDAIHVSFALHLRWSPNLRSFMGLKRKSNKKIDEVEDGGRAKILEEAIILEIHLQAKAFEQFIIDSGGEVYGSPYDYENTLNFPFLRRLHKLTLGYEVEQNPKQDWENAIRDGYRCYHRLKEANGGILKVNMADKTIEFSDFNGIESLDYDNPELLDE